MTIGFYRKAIVAAFCLSLLSAAPVGGPVEDLPQRGENKHLAHESDSVSRFIVYDGFVAMFDSLLREPRFTIHLLTPAQLSSDSGLPAKRRSSFIVDPRVGQASATNADYRGSGYDRGHMVPAGDFYHDKRMKDETFVYTKVTPQLPGVNRSLWSFIEQSIRTLVTRWSAKAYVITGAIFAGDSVDYIGGGQLRVPSYLYKVVYVPDSLKMYGLLVSNEYVTTYANLCDLQLPVDNLEEMAGEDFFDLLPDSAENRLESRVECLSSALGFEP